VTKNILLDLSNIISSDEMKNLVFNERKTHQEISDMLKEMNPGIGGLSLISVRRYCVKNGIRTKKFLNEKDITKETYTQVTTSFSYYKNTLYKNT